MSLNTPFLRGGVLVAALAFSFFSEKSFGQVLVSFSFTGSEQTWVVPSGINSIRIEAAGGGDSYFFPGRADGWIGLLEFKVSIGRLGQPPLPVLGRVSVGSEVGRMELFKAKKTAGGV